MASSDFENLDAYRLTERIADEIWGLVMGGDSFAKTTSGGLLVRAADSIGTNITEGCGRGSQADNRRFVRTARGSPNQTRHWLRRAYRRKLLIQEEVDRLRPMIRELRPRLNAWVNSIGGFPPAPAANTPRTGNREHGTRNAAR